MLAQIIVKCNESIVINEFMGNFMERKNASN